MKKSYLISLILAILLSSLSLVKADITYIKDPNDTNIVMTAIFTKLSDLNEIGNYTTCNFKGKALVTAYDESKTTFSVYDGTNLVEFNYSDMSTTTGNPGDENYSGPATWENFSPRIGAVVTVMDFIKQKDVNNVKKSRLSVQEESGSTYLPETQSVNIASPSDADLNKYVSISASNLSIAEGTFAAGGTYTLSSGTSSIKIKMLTGANYIGRRIPTAITELKGILVKEGTEFAIMPLSYEDFIQADNAKTTLAELISSAEVNYEVSYSGNARITMIDGNNYYIQDASGKAMLLKSNSAISGATRDGAITAFTGTYKVDASGCYSIENPTNVSIGSNPPAIDPKELNLADYPFGQNEKAKQDLYVLIKTKIVSDGSIRYESDKNYDINNAAGKSATNGIWTAFSTADYIGENSPVASQDYDLIGLYMYKEVAGLYDFLPKTKTSCIAPRDKADITGYSSQAEDAVVNPKESISAMKQGLSYFTTTATLTLTINARVEAKFGSVYFIGDGKEVIETIFETDPNLKVGDFVTKLYGQIKLDNEKSKYTFTVSTFETATEGLTITPQEITDLTSDIVGDYGYYGPQALQDAEGKIFTLKGVSFTSDYTFSADNAVKVNFGTQSGKNLLMANYATADYINKTYKAGELYDITAIVLVSNVSSSSYYFVPISASAIKSQNPEEPEEPEMLECSTLAEFYANKEQENTIFTGVAMVTAKDVTTSQTNVWIQDATAAYVLRFNGYEEQKGEDLRMGKLVTNIKGGSFENSWEENLNYYESGKYEVASAEAQPPFLSPAAIAFVDIDEYDDEYNAKVSSLVKMQDLYFAKTSATIFEAGKYYSMGVIGSSQTKSMLYITSTSELVGQEIPGENDTVKLLQGVFMFSTSANNSTPAIAPRIESDLLVAKYVAPEEPEMEEYESLDQLYIAISRLKENATLKYTGEAIITHVEYSDLYVQDSKYGTKLKIQGETSQYQTGMAITNMEVVVTVTDYGWMQQQSSAVASAEVYETDQVPAIIELTQDQASSEMYNYENRLVKVKNVSISCEDPYSEDYYEDKTKFEDWCSYTLTFADGSKIADGLTPLGAVVGQDIPSGRYDIIGIASYMGDMMPRTMADFIEAEEGEENPPVEPGEATAVEDIATLRDQDEDANYTLEGTALVTMVYNNEMWIQDATRGIKLSNKTGEEWSVDLIGKGLSNVTGKLTYTKGSGLLLECASFEEAAVAPEVEAIDVTSVNSISAYEGSLVVLKGIYFAYGDGSTMFSYVNMIKRSKDGTTDYTTMINNEFEDASGLGEITLPLSSQEVNVYGIVYREGSNIAPRSAKDIEIVGEEIVLDTIEVETIAEIKALENVDAIYKFVGEAVLTANYADMVGDKYIILQDKEAAVSMLNSGEEIELNSVLSNIEFTISKALETKEFRMKQYEIAEESTLTVEPKELSLQELQSDGANYRDMLILVKNVRISNIEREVTTTVPGEEEQVDTTYMDSRPQIGVAYDLVNKAGDKAEKAIYFYFNDQELMSQQLAGLEMNITGICRLSGTSYAVSPRNWADIETIATSMEQAMNQASMLVYPNPAREGRFVILLPEEGGKVEILSQNGMLVKSYSNVSNKLECNGLESGLYLVRYTKEGKSKVSKLVVY